MEAKLYDLKPAYYPIREAWKWYDQRDSICYFFGAKFSVLDDALMDYLIANEAWYFKRYTAGELLKIKDFSRGKIGTDCSGFICKIIGCDQIDSVTLWSRCVNKTGVKNCKAGSLLYAPGHIGIDIGYGRCMHIGKELETIRLEANSAWKWEGGGEIDLLDYSMMHNY